MQLLRIQDAILLLNSQTVHPTRTTNKKETRKQTWEAAQKSEIRDVSNFRWSFFFIPFETVRRRLERPNKIIFSFQNNDLSSLIWQKINVIELNTCYATWKFVCRSSFCICYLKPKKMRIFQLQGFYAEKIFLSLRFFLAIVDFFNSGDIHHGNSGFPKICGLLFRG